MTTKIKKILIIEDDILISTLCTNALTQNGYDVIVTDKGESGIEYYKTWRPDVIVTDIHLPYMSGLDVIKYCKEKNENVPIIAVSGDGDARDHTLLMQAKQIGADAVLKKPFTYIELLSELERLRPEPII